MERRRPGCAGKRRSRDEKKLLGAMTTLLEVQRSVLGPEKEYTSGGKTFSNCLGVGRRESRCCLCGIGLSGVTLTCVCSVVEVNAITARMINCSKGANECRYCIGRTNGVAKVYV